jgi:cytochrome c-type biogenesis protein CcmH/NrfG
MAIIGGIAEGMETTKRRETFQFFAAVPMVLFIAFVSYYSYRAYAAEYYLRKSIEAAIANNGSATYDFQRKAINMNPQRSEYRNTYAQTNLLLASNLSQSENLTDNDRSTIQTLIAQAIREARLSTEVVNPLSAGSWEVRANVYRSLIGVADNADRWALGAYNTAIQLDPTNPRLRLEAGGIYYVNQDYLSAANLFRQATNLKPDYANAHYNLAQALKQLQNYPLAQRELELVLRLIDQDSIDYQRVTAEIEELKTLTAGQAQGNPTVESLDQQAQIEEQGQITAQESLTPPGNANTISEGQINLNQQGQVQNQGQQPQEIQDQGEAQ